jgi:hypothetical protein
MEQRSPHVYANYVVFRVDSVSSMVHQVQVQVQMQAQHLADKMTLVLKREKRMNVCVWGRVLLEENFVGRGCCDYW